MPTNTTKKPASKGGALSAFIKKASKEIVFYVNGERVALLDINPRMTLCGETAPKSSPGHLSA